MKKKKVFIVLIIAAACAFVFVPVRLQAKLKDDVTHSYEKLTRDDVEVNAVTLARLKWRVGSYRFSLDEEEEYRDAVVNWAHLTGRIHVSEVAAGSISAVYRDPAAKNGDAFRASRVAVSVRFVNGYEKEIADADYTAPDTIDENEVTIISTDYGNTVLQYDIATPVGIEVTCEDGLYEGDRIADGSVSAKAIYADGSSVEIRHTDDFTTGYAVNGAVGTAYTAYGTAEIYADAVPITGARAEQVYHAGETPDAEDMILVYRNGTEKQADPDGISFTDSQENGGTAGVSETSRTLSEGKNEIPFTYFGQRHTLYIHAAGYTRAGRAALVNTEELSASVYTHTDSDVYAAVRHMTGSGISYYLAHIIINDPAQLTFDASGSDSAVVWAGIRDSYAPFVRIRNGASQGEAETTGHEICFTSEGAIFSPGAGYQDADLIRNKVTYSFGTDAPVLINNGQATNEGNSNGMGREVRNCIGMASPGDYYLLVCDGGLTFREMQNVMLSVGCTYARPFAEGVSFSFGGESVCGTGYGMDGAFCVNE